MASRMFSNEGYLPVPTINRDLNSLPPSQSDVSYIWSSAFSCVTHPPPMGRTISTLSPSLSTAVAYSAFGVTSRLSATAMYSRRTRSRCKRSSIVTPSGRSIDLPFTLTTIKENRTSNGCGRWMLGRDAFPSLELPSAGSRGPGPHPVLRKPPPAAHYGLYTVELAAKLLGRRDRRLAHVVAAHVGGSRSRARP